MICDIFLLSHVLSIFSCKFLKLFMAYSVKTELLSDVLQGFPHRKATYPLQCQNVFSDTQSNSKL